MDIQSPWTFGHGDLVAPGYFGTETLWHLKILAQGCFSTWTFWHWKILALWKAILRFLHRNFVPVPKCYTGPKPSFCRNVHVSKCSSAEMSLCRKVPMPKYPYPGAEMSLCQKVLGLCAKKFMCSIVFLWKRP